jgi:hypothetical protein
MKEISSIQSIDLINKLVKSEKEGLNELESYNWSTSLSYCSYESNGSNELCDSFSNDESNKNLELYPIQIYHSIFKKSLSKTFFSKFIEIRNNSRSSYFHKLISKNLLIRPQKKINNIFIFDWDDTLLCTSVLSPNGYFDDDREILPSVMEKIEKMEKLVKSILLQSINKGDVYIITNSQLAWIYYSCQRFYPIIYKLLPKIKLMSARDLYEKKYPNDSKIWKLKTFNDIVKNYSLYLPTNIICLGDSSDEIDAANDLVSKFPNGYIKAIKFREFPLISDLIKQLTSVINKFEKIYSSCKNITINIDQEE